MMKLKAWESTKIVCNSWSQDILDYVITRLNFKSGSISHTPENPTFQPRILIYYFFYIITAVTITIKFRLEFYLKLWLINKIDLNWQWHVHYNIKGFFLRFFFSGYLVDSFQGLKIVAFPEWIYYEVCVCFLFHTLSFIKFFYWGFCT